jgi:hypothetical protein
MALTLGVAASAAAAPHRSSALRTFTFNGAGTNYVNIGTGELNELWSGNASARVGRTNAFGKITTHVAGWLQRPTPTTLAVSASWVVVSPSRDVLIAACTGTGIVPAPNGSEDWNCHATGGTGKFARSRGQWTLHIVISRIWNRNGVQHNRFTINGRGRLSWNGS